jgi:protein-S-isoprenylcysteine O-methyltransferase Ste14
MTEQPLSSSANKLIRLTAFRFILAVIIWGLILFLPAGTLRYWYACIFCGIFFISMFLISIYFLKHDPALLERRMRVGEKTPRQQLLKGFFTFTMVLPLVMPGFDYRFKWSSVPIAVVVIADLFVFSGYVVFFYVLKENTYASRILEVAQDQKVISTGPYALVRHPMYLAALVMLIFSPLALGSFWAMIGLILMPFALILRIKAEEKLLMRELAGYPEYAQRVRYRLIPGIW